MKTGATLETSTNLRKAGLPPWTLTFIQKALSWPPLATPPLHQASIALPLMINATWPPEAWDHSFISCSGYLTHKLSRIRVPYLCSLVLRAHQTQNRSCYGCGKPKTQRLADGKLFGIWIEFPCRGWVLWTGRLKKNFNHSLYFWST